MTQTKYEIQRKTNDGYSICRACQLTFEQAQRELAAILRDDPKGKYRIVMRTEQVVFEAVFEAELKS